MSKATIEGLRAQVRGAVITKDDARYDDARRVHNGMFDKRPYVVLRAEQTADVVAGVSYARDTGLPLAVRGGGHSAPGFGTNEGGVVIDLSPMKTVWVDAKALHARAGGGATWGDFNHATHAFGLATTGGIVSTTGIAGLTLGGGIGYLSRGYGLSCDNLLSAEVVLADGRVVTASPRDNPDLFWALRGGGGNFGVVTSFEYALHPIKDVFVGLFFYELSVARDLFRFYREYIKDAPRGLGGFPAFHVAPPLEFLPKERHGQTFCAAVVHWAGPLAQGERVMKPFRDLAEPVGQMVTAMPYPALNAAFDGLFPKGIRSYWKGSFVRELTDAAIDAHLEHGPKIPTVNAAMHLYPINGACWDVRPEASAFAYRDATFAEVIVCAWNDPKEDAARMKWVRDYYAATSKHAEAGGYINFMADDDQPRIADNYRGNYARLRDVKKKYDPSNLFHLNQNIRPA